MTIKQKISNDIHYYYTTYLKYKGSIYVELEMAYYSMFQTMKELYVEKYL